jgi:YVTN family beta-propeller protein
MTGLRLEPKLRNLVRLNSNSLLFTQTKPVKLLLAALLLSSATLSLAQPVFVLNSASATISVIDPKTWEVKDTLPTGKEPHHMYLSPDEKSLIVANAASDSLTFLDPQTAKIQRTVRNIRDPYHLRFSPDMKWFITAANRLNHIDIYAWVNNEPVLKKRIPTGKVPSHLWVDSKSTVLYATMQDSNELIAIDLAKRQNGQDASGYFWINR